MSLRSLLDTLESEIEECLVDDQNDNEISYAQETLGKIVSIVDDIERWNNQVKDVIEKAQGSDYLEDLVEELTEPVENIGSEVY
ncbi:MAG: hypothetical protein PQJ49_07985 [Sphaerochaetaceae bacterium]|nr:hypothetical protein [Sphaerochaetaceae bacterium]